MDATLRHNDKRMEEENELNEGLIKAIEEKYTKKYPDLSKVERTTLTVQEIAKYIGLSVDMIYKLCRQKQIPHIKIGSRTLFKLNSIDKWLEDLEYSPE